MKSMKKSILFGGVKMNVKRLLCLSVALALALCLLSGCSREPDSDTEEPGELEDPTGLLSLVSSTSSITVRNGNNGTEAEITDQSDIETILTCLKDTDFESGRPVDVQGWAYCVIFKDGDGKELADIVLLGRVSFYFNNIIYSNKSAGAIYDIASDLFY